MELSIEQQKVLDDTIDLVRQGQKLITIGGYAGTGKTYLISYINEALRKNQIVKRIAYATYTGKASSVLKQKLSIISLIDYVGTIHSLMYYPKTRYDPKLKKHIIVGWVKNTTIPYDLIIIDEASMLPIRILNDLLSYQVQIIAVGDHGQLPPVGDEKSNILNSPNLFLKTIHRQCQNSPIISLSQFIRNNGYIPFNTVFAKNVFKIEWQNSICQKLWKNISINDDLIVLCGFNKTRVKINNELRERNNYTKKYPYAGEKIICLKNNKDVGIMNGEISTLIWSYPLRENFFKLTLTNSVYQEPIECLASSICYGKDSYDSIYEFNQKKYDHILKENMMSSINFFDYGYCISVHKSQGSEWEKVVLFEQRTSKWDDEFYARWLYTAVTRAKNGLFIISDYYN